MLKIAVIGGDMRLSYLAGALERAGYPVERRYSLQDNQTLEGIGACRAAVMPVPMCSDAKTLYTPLCGEAVLTTEEVFAALPKKCVALCGKPGQLQKMQAQEQRVELIDLMRLEEFAIFNAEMTAEGAIGIAMSELPVTLYGSACLVTGYGRIGKELLRLLRAFGAKVYVAARKEADFAWISLSGGIPVRYGELPGVAPELNILFNTVPSMVVEDGILEALHRDCLVMELASALGGVDLQKAQELGLKHVRALSLPGRCAPKSSGELLAGIVERCLFDRGMVCERKLP